MMDENSVVLLDERTGHATTAGNDPSVHEMLAPLNRERSERRKKNGDGFYLSLGEAVGRFVGYDNQRESNKLRAEICKM